MSTRTVAFFGATGGCTNACLALTIQHGHSAIALVRSREKLMQQLQERLVSQSVIDERLKIVVGDVKDTAKVREVLGNGVKGVDTIISGIGGIPTPQLSIFRPITLTEPICSNAITSILEAVGQRNSYETPLIVVISANGVSNTGTRDYPIILTPLYRWLLTGVYDDKREMEAALERHLPNNTYVIVRPSALTNGAGKGCSSVRQGSFGSPVQGYSISRDDVGLWLFTHLVAAEDRTGLRGQQLCITY